MMHMDRMEQPSDTEGDNAYRPNDAMRRAIEQGERMVRRASRPHHHRFRSEDISSDGRIHEVLETARFRKDVRMMRKGGADIGPLDDVIGMLSRGVEPPESSRDRLLN